MEMKQKECGIVCKENKLTINILIQRLLAHEKGRE